MLVRRPTWGSHMLSEPLPVPNSSKSQATHPKQVQPQASSSSCRLGAQGLLVNCSLSSSMRRKGDAPAQPLHSPKGAGHESGITLDRCGLNRSCTITRQHILTPQGYSTCTERAAAVCSHMSSSYSSWLRLLLAPARHPMPRQTSQLPASQLPRVGTNKCDPTRCLSQKIPTPPTMPSLTGTWDHRFHFQPVSSRDSQHSVPALWTCCSSAVGSRASAMGTQTTQIQCTNRNGTKDSRPAALHPVSKSARNSPGNPALKAVPRPGGLIRPIGTA